MAVTHSATLVNTLRRGNPKRALNLLDHLDSAD